MSSPCMPCPYNFALPLKETLPVPVNNSETHAYEASKCTVVGYIVMSCFKISLVAP